MYDLVRKSRTYRRFYEEVTIGIDVISELVELARLSPSAGNRQPLKFIISTSREKNDLIFQSLAWAGYLKEWPGPVPGERPAAYIIILGDKEIASSFGCDHGIAAQSIMLGANEKGFGGCILGNIKREKLASDLDIPSRYEILLVLALGRPKEVVVIEETGADGVIKYWRDAQEVHHVPKRSLSELITGRYE